MPIWLRNATFDFINSHYEAESKAYEEAKQGSSSTTKTLVDSSGKVNIPNFQEASAPYKRTSYK